MTTELEQQFFKVFGIEPRYIGSIWNSKETQIKNFENIYEYPEITDRKLLKLICINSYFCGVNFHNLWVKNLDELKAIILDEIIRWYKEQKYGYEKCKHQIQQLFKEE